MLPLAPIGSSYFLSVEVGIVNDLINKTVNYPDVVEPHRFDSKKIIKKKTFSFNVGCHGLSGFFCRTVLVVVKKNDNTIVTAYPIM